MRAACQSRPGGYPPGRCGPKIALIKPDWNAKKSLGIFPRSDYVPLTTSVQGCWPRRCHIGRLTGGGQSSQSESPPRVKGSKTQVQLSAMALESCATPDRKVNESLILRLKTHARKLCLFWQAECLDAASAVRWTAGERVFVE